MIARVARVAAAFVMLAVASGAAAEYARHVIEVSLQPAAARLHVHDEITVQDRRDYRFVLAPWITLAEVSVDGARTHAVAQGEGWRIDLPDSGPHRVRLTLHGQRPEVAATGALMADDGVYLPAASGWLPLSAEPWLAYDLTVSVPLPWRALTSGRLAAETTDTQHYRARFVAAYPAAAPALFAGPWQVQERHAAGVRLRTYFDADLAPLAGDYLAAAGRHLAHFSASIGQYPYADFHIVSSPLPVGLGFANLTYIGRRVLPLPFMRERSLAHEVLHNWWGNGVAVDYRGGNWAEGLTTYLADHALAARRDPAAAREMRLGWLRDFSALPPERDYPLTHFTAKGHDASQVIGYNKTAFVFHMLAQELGSDAFSRGLREVWQARRSRLTRWGHLRDAFEQAAGRDLGWFFAQWLSRTGAPSLALSRVQSTTRGSGHRLRLTLLQSARPWRLAVPVSVETVSGTQHHVLPITERVSTHTLTTDEPARRVHVDPGYDVFRRLASGEVAPILRDVTLDAAARVLIADEDPAYRHAALRLAARLLDAVDDPTPAPGADALGGPVLLIGSRERLLGLLAPLGIAPEALRDAQAARAGAVAVRRGDGAAGVLVFAPDAPALQMLQRRLPHYGGKSYVLIDADGRPRSGVFAPADDSPLIHVLTGE